ncbi:hypothetical protein [Methanoculleus chikugoensis]|uniref:hypothetical protein n=1 Tax=Methanoculleus chikugoensis TaxID=118126 RepID=UPI0006D21F27|nr:hypothetical protein [Methanoculleus chikugoensis]
MHAPGVGGRVPLDTGGAMEMKEMQERSEVILERRTRTAGEEWFMSADDILDKNVINRRETTSGGDLGYADRVPPRGQGAVPGAQVRRRARHGGKEVRHPAGSVIYRPPGDDNFVVNIDKQRLDDLPGFDEDHWPPREADYSLIQSAGTMTPPTREEAEAMRREETPPPDVVTTERVETRPRRR